MVSGIVLSSVGDKLIISQPLGHTEPAWVTVIFGGPALFLTCRGVLDYAAFSHISWSRPIGLFLLAALAPVALRLPPIMVTGMVAVLLAGIAIANVLSWRLFPRTPSPPTGFKRR
jgi:low temperature requirement protein LtrA